MRAKKRLGQNFLKSRQVVEKMAETAKVRPEDAVLEIGPGKGILTKVLLEKGARVLAVEKDKGLYGLLSDKFRKEIASKQLLVVEGDIREFEPEGYGLKPAGYKLIANIPYYLTGEIIRKFLSANTHPELATLLVQNEVADRIVAQDGKESVLSISVKVYGNPKKVMFVPAKLFEPAPKVDSAVILIDKISKDFFRNFSEKEFFNILKTGFAHKRKKLVSNLSPAFIEKSAIEDILKNIGIGANARPEELTVEDWKKVFISLAKEKSRQ